MAVGDNRVHLRLAPRAEGRGARSAPYRRQPLRRRDRLRAYRDARHVAVHLPAAHKRPARLHGSEKPQQLLDLLEAVRHAPETPSPEDCGPCRPCAVRACGTSRCRHRCPVLPVPPAVRLSGGQAPVAAAPGRENRPGHGISARAAATALPTRPISLRRHDAPQPRRRADAALSATLCRCRKGARRQQPAAPA